MVTSGLWRCHAGTASRHVASAVVTKLQPSGRGQTRSFRICKWSGHGKQHAGRLILSPVLQLSLVSHTRRKDSIMPYILVGFGDFGESFSKLSQYLWLCRMQSDCLSVNAPAFLGIDMATF